MASVTLRSGESQQNLLRLFRKKVMKAGILRDARKKRYFVSKSVQRRLDKRKALRRERRRQSRQESRRRR